MANPPDSSWLEELPPSIKRYQYKGKQDSGCRIWPLPTTCGCQWMATLRGGQRHFLSRLLQGRRHREILVLLQRSWKPLACQDNDLRAFHTGSVWQCTYPSSRTNGPRTCLANIFRNDHKGRWKKQARNGRGPRRPRLGHDGKWPIVRAGGCCFRVTVKTSIRCPFLAAGRPRQSKGRLYACCLSPEPQNYHREMGAERWSRGLYPAGHSLSGSRST